MNPEDLQKLVTMAMPFGKHKGKVLANLPGNYLTWFAREGFPKGEIGRLLALMHEIDNNVSTVWLWHRCLSTRGAVDSGPSTFGTRAIALGYEARMASSRN